MIRCLFVLVLGLQACLLVAQTTTTKPQKEIKQKKPPKESKNWFITDIKGRANDHLMVEFGYLNWIGAPASFRMTGFSHYFAFSLFYDIPFKTNPHLSIAPGLALSLNRVYMDKVNAELTALETELAFKDVSQGVHFDEHGFFYSVLSPQIELRYIQKPQQPGRSWKIALGARLGIVLDAFNRNVDRKAADGSELAHGVEEYHSTKYFQFPVIELTARFGYGPINLVVGYQANGLFTSVSQAPPITPLRVGLALTGL